MIFFNSLAVTCLGPVVMVTRVRGQIPRCATEWAKITVLLGLGLAKLGFEQRRARRLHRSLRHRARPVDQSASGR
jgi:hypothetical protein